MIRSIEVSDWSAPSDCCPPSIPAQPQHVLDCIGAAVGSSVPSQSTESPWMLPCTIYAIYIPFWFETWKRRLQNDPALGHCVDADDLASTTDAWTTFTDADDLALAIDTMRGSSVDVDVLTSSRLGFVLFALTDSRTCSEDGLGLADTRTSSNFASAVY